MQAERNLREHFLRGLRRRVEAFRNQPGLALLKNARVTEDGIRPLPVIATESAIEALGAGWPFPQLGRYMDRSIVFDDGTADPQTIDEYDNPWTLTTLPLRDRYGNAASVSNNRSYQIASFGAFLFVCGSNGQVYYNRNGDLTELTVADFTCKSAIAFRNSQLVLGGLGKPVGIPGNGAVNDSLNAFLIRRAALDSNYPLPANTPYQSGFPHDMTAWIWWSSVGGGDATILYEPWEHMLPGDSYLVLDPEHITNGTFDADTTGWAVGTGWARSGSKMVATAATGNLNTTHATAYDINPAYDSWYELSFIWNASSGTCHIECGKDHANDWHSEPLPESTGGDITITMPIYFVGEATEANPPQIYFVPQTAGFTGTVDSVSLKKVVAHQQNYNENLPSYIQYGDMEEIVQAVLDAAWGVSDGVSSWSSVPRFSMMTNGNMYAGADSAGPAARSHKTFQKANWPTTVTTQSDYLTHSFGPHVDETNPFWQLPAYGFQAPLAATTYKVQIYIYARTAGSVQVTFGDNSGTDDRTNTTGPITANGLTTFVGLQTDTLVGVVNRFNVIPTDDFDGHVSLLHVEDEDFVVLDAFAMESHTNHTALKQLSSAMNKTVVADKRYKITWQQMTMFPTNMERDGEPIYEWNQIDIGTRPCNAPLYWDIETASVDWFCTPRRNILKNSTFQNGNANHWTFGGTWSLNSSTSRVEHPTGSDATFIFDGAELWASLVHERVYDVVVEIRDFVTGPITVRLGATFGTGNSHTLTPISGNGFYKFTLTADDQVTNWEDFEIFASSTTDLSVGEVLLLDRTILPDDPTAACFESWGQSVMTQAPNLMNLYPVIVGKSYEFRWEILDTDDASTIRLLLGGSGVGSPQTAAGIYTETFICGGSPSVGLQVQHQGSDGAIRIIIYYVKPLFNDAVRPKLGGEVFDTGGVNSYFENTASGIFEKFSRTILIPASPANLDLEFEFKHSFAPMRIHDVSIDPLDEVASVDMEPKPIIFDYFERNESGFLPMPFPGAILRILELGEHIMIYGTNYVCFVQTHTDPIHAKTAHPILGYPRTLGVAHVVQDISGDPDYLEPAVFGDHSEHIFVDEKGELWHVAAGALPVLTKLGYQEFFTPMLGNTIVITRDQDTEAWFISDNNTGYYLKDGRLSETPYAVSFLEYSEGGLVGHKESFLAAGEDETLEVLTNSFDGEGMGLHEILRVQLIGRATDAGAYALGPEMIEVNPTFDSDLSGWTAAFGGWTWDAGNQAAQSDASPPLQSLRYDDPDEAFGIRDQWYRTKFDIVERTSGIIRLTVGATQGIARSTVATFEEDIQAQGSGIPSFGPVDSNVNLQIDNVSVKKLNSGLPFAVYIDAKLHDGDNWTRFGPFWPDNRGMVLTKITGVEFRIYVESGDANLVELDDIRYEIRDDGKRSLSSWLSAI